ncbi:VOC family protein [Arthrobacter oryzae]|uniref:VOC family protein n=1 Tax=Arthrobacter oryzae TaxID=409290 RepID=UPI00273B6B37|nr:VOC family protein [Arthrobacter oryzae]WLQ08459.1 VOC family protein [Arthrobacter oryzae]
MNPITPRIGTVFVPVSDVEAARDWYCRLLGVPADGEILFGHLYVLPVEGTGLVLDSRIYSRDAVFKVPAFHLDTQDVQAAHAYAVELGADPAAIQYGQWFNFRDPDGNALMVCQC